MVSFQRIYFDYKIEKTLAGTYRIVKGEGRGKSLRIIRQDIPDKQTAERALKLAKRHRW